MEWYFRVWPWSRHLCGLISFGNRGWDFHLLNWRPSHWLKWGRDDSWYDGPWFSFWAGPFFCFATTPDYYIDWKAARKRYDAHATEQNSGGDA